MSTPLGSPIAIGRTAEVYAWPDGQVLKLYFSWCPRRWIDHEARIGRIVQNAGLPVPAMGEIVEVNGRVGLIYERVDGPSMLSVLKARSWAAARYGRQFADLHAALHSLTVSDLPSYKDGLARAIQRAGALPENARSVLLQRLDRLPDGDALCHGDLHPDNIVMTKRGPIIIDWMTACRGHAAADVARSWLLLNSGTPVGLNALELRLLGFLRWQFTAAYLKRYFQLCPDARDQVTAWHPIIAAARLNENVPGERDWLLARIKAGLD